MVGYHALHDSHATRLRDALSISLADLRLAERNANQERERMLLALPQPVGVPVGAPHRLLHRRARHHQRVVAAWEAQGNLHRRGRAHLSGADELRDEPRHLCRTQARSAFVAGFVVGSCEASLDHTSGCPRLRPASADQPVGPYSRWPGAPALVSTCLATSGQLNTSSRQGSVVAAPPMRPTWQSAKANKMGSAGLQICRSADQWVPGLTRRLEWRTLTPSLSCSPPCSASGSSGSSTSV